MIGRILILIFCIVSFVFKGQAQDIIELDSVVISASQISMERYKTGKSVEVIDGEDIAKYPVNSLDDLLRYVSGMNINSRGSFGVQSDIGMRGSTFSQVVVLVDGVRINDPLTGHFNNNFPVALADISRVEVVRGPAAVSYGSDAVGGMIHIRTKTNLELESPEKSSGVIDRSFGQNNLRTTDAGAQIAAGGGHFSVSYRKIKADGEEIDNPNFPGTNGANEKYYNFFNLNTVSLSSSHKLSPTLGLQTRVSYDFRDFSAKYFYTRSSFDESVEETTNLWTQITLVRQKEKNDIRLNFSYKNSTDFFEFNPMFSPNDHTMNQTFLNLTQNIELGKGAKFGYGAQILNKEIESTDRGDHSNLNVAGYALFSKEVMSNLHANLGVRLENDENFGTELLPQASLSYRMDNWLIRSSYGRSVRAADFTERYVSFNIPSLSPLRNAGNPDLVAEESNSFDLGIDYKRVGYGLSLTGFMRSSKNLIDFSLVNETEITNLMNLQDSADYFYATNVSDTDVMGVEFTSYLVKELSSKLKMRTDLAYTYIKTEGSDRELSKYISNHPEHNISGAVLLYGDTRLSLGLNGNYLVRQEELVEDSPFAIPSGYFLLNTMLSYRAEKNFFVYGKVYNITDTQYQEILGAKMPGSWWSLGVRFEIK